MKKLTKKEEEIMNIFWEKGALFVREIAETYPNPRRHFNNISTFVRILENKGYIYHKAYGLSYQYYPVISKEEFSRMALENVVSTYFKNSYTSAVSALIKNGNISVDELRQLIKQIDEQK